MKRIINYLQGLAALAAFMLFSLLGYTQEGGGTDINVDINKGESNWYAQPWVWIVGGAVFILLLVALLRRGGERE